MTANLLEQAKELAAKCDALRKERYNTPRWDPEPMQLLFYCAEVLREVPRVQAEARRDELNKLVEHQQGTPCMYRTVGRYISERLAALAQAAAPAKETQT